MTSQPFMKPILLVLIVSILAVGKIRPQGMGHPITGPLPPGAKSPKCINRTVPQLEDISAKAGIAFTHKSSQVKRYIFESMTGGVIVFDYDRDGWPDIYFTNAPTIEMALQGQTASGELYRNNHDGTFTDVTQKVGLNKACPAMGGAVGEWNLHRCIETGELRNCMSFQ